jgi:hypothetical protein
LNDTIFIGSSGNTSSVNLTNLKIQKVGQGYKFIYIYYGGDIRIIGTKEVFFLIYFLLDTVFLPDLVGQDDIYFFAVYTTTFNMTDCSCSGLYFVSGSYGYPLFYFNLLIMLYSLSYKTVIFQI